MQGQPPDKPEQRDKDAMVRVDGIGCARLGDMNPACSIAVIISTRTALYPGSSYTIRVHYVDIKWKRTNRSKRKRRKKHGP